MVLSNNSSNQDLQSLSSTVTATPNICENNLDEEAMHTLEVARLQRVGDDAGSFGQVKNRRLQLTRRFSVACLDHPAAEATAQEEPVPLMTTSEHGGYAKEIADRRRRLVRCLSGTDLSLTKLSSTSSRLIKSNSLILPHEEMDNSSACSGKIIPAMQDRLGASNTDMEKSFTYDNSSWHSMVTFNSFHSIVECEESSDDENQDSFALCSKATLMTEDEQVELLSIASEILEVEPQKSSKDTTTEIKEKRELKLPLNTRRDARGEPLVESRESSLMALITSDSRHSKKSNGAKSKKSKQKCRKSTKISKEDESSQSLKGSSCDKRSSRHSKSKKSKRKRSKSSTKGSKQ